MTRSTGERSRARSHLVWASGMVVLCLLRAPVAQAQPSVATERAAEAIANGDYEAGAAQLDALLARNDLNRAALVRVLALQAVLHRGMADDDALDRALRALASVAPEHRFGARHPPDLDERAADARRRVPRIEVQTRIVPSAVGVRLVADTRDPENLIRALRYRVFDAASAQWTRAEPPVEASGAHEVLVFVEAIGPGGAVVAQDGSPDEPIRLRGPGSPSAREEPASTDDGWVPWVVGGAIVAVVAGIAIAIGVAVAEGSGLTWRPSPPREVP